MKNTAGQIAEVTMGGVQTVRFNLGSGDFDYLLFIPVETGNERPRLSISRSGNTITVTWIGGGTLQASPAVAGAGVNWQNVDSDGTYTTTMVGDEDRFFRVVR